MALQTLIPAFQNHLPVRIYFGNGISGVLPELLSNHNAERILLVADAGVEEFNPAAREAIAGVERSGATLVRYDKPPGEPTVAMIDDATRALKQSGAQAIAAIGGGSVIDTAKTARLCGQQELTFREFLSSQRLYPEPVMPLFAIPTTAGTGSEVSGGAVVMDPEAGKKSGIANPNLRAQYALVDPTLTYSCPPSTTAYAGVDALAQAIAAMIARSRTPIGDAMALEAIRLISRSLVTAFREGTPQSRSDVACGSMMAGLAMNISDCTAEHSLGQAIGGLFNAPHGLTVGLVLVETLTRENAYVPDQLQRVADAMGAPANGSGGARAIAAVRDLLAELDFPVLSSLGVTDEHLDDLTALALEDYFITESPEAWTAREVRQAFSRALEISDRRL